MFLSSGTNYTNAANGVVPKSYVDSVGSGLIPYGRVKAISTYDSSGNNTQYPVPINSNIILPFYIDGVSIDVGNNVLLNDQGGGTTANVNNGVYTLNDVSGDYKFQRSTTIMPVDVSSNAAYISVVEGTVNSLSGWVQTHDDPPNTVGQSAMLFSNFFSFAFKLGQGLYPTPQDGQIYINVDSSLNFINYIDGSNNDTLNIGTNTNTINIGKTTTVISGNVGIEKTPSYTLDVSGNTNVSGISYFNTKQFTPWPPTPYEICTNAPIQIKSVYDQNDKLILTSDPSNNSAGTIQYIWDSDTSSNILYRQLQLNPYGGSVFINKLTPDPLYTNSYALDVSGCINSSSADSQSFIAFQNKYLGTTYFYGMGTITSALCFSANRPLNSNTPQMVLTSDGNVGIGTTAPAYRLDVSGNMRINNPLSGYNGLTINQDPAGYALNILKYTDPSNSSTGGILIGGSGSYNPSTQPNDFTIVASGPVNTTPSPPSPSTVPGEDTGVMNLTVWSAVKNGLRLTYTTATLTETGSIFLNAPYVGVGKSSGSGYALDVSGNVNATSYNTPSDYRIKENVTQIDSTFVDKLNPVTYLNTKSGKQDIGLIAHELQEIYPELVNGEKDGEQFQSVNYIGLIPVLIKEIQDLKKEIILVKTELNELKNK
jgi:hypothetical protein